MNAPREPLHDRADRLKRDRRLLLALPPAFIAAVWAIGAVGGAGRSATSPETQLLIIGMLAAMACCVLFATWSARAQAAATRKITAHPIGTPAHWPVLDSARESYKLLTGESPPECAFKSRSDVGDLIDAELVLLGAIDSDGNRSVVPPFSGSAAATPVVAFNEMMLDTFSAEELVAVMLHLLHRLRVYTGAAGRSASGVFEADCHALLTVRDHVALLGAIEKTRRRESTYLPYYGLIFFSDQDVTPRLIRRGAKQNEWLVQDRLAALRAHLGAAALDVPESC